jgi:hypothetical protein
MKTFLKVVEVVFAAAFMLIVLYAITIFVFTL